MSDSLIDRILNGEFNDDEGDNTLPSEVILNVDPDPAEDDEEVDGDWDDGEFEEIPSEEIEDEYGPYDNTSSDDPTEEWTPSGSEALASAMAEEETQKMAYVEMPKQAKTRNTGNTNMEPDDTKTELPKQSVTETKTNQGRRGAPHKLKEHMDEVSRLYQEGVNAKLLAEKYGVSVSCVINSLKRAGVEIRSKGRQKTKSE